MKKFARFFIVVTGLLALGRMGWCQQDDMDYFLESNDATALESSARYNYHLGQYYYNQGDLTTAEQHFQRSRDMMSRRKNIASNPDVATLEIQPVRGANRNLEYIIADGDVLHISVWENDDLEQEAVVRPDGRISFPLVGDIMARGRTIVELDEMLTELLKEFIRAPEVSISIRKLGGSKVIILGQVRRPGVYAVSGSKTVLEAVALAGGFTPDAVSNSVVLIRGGLVDPQAQRLNLKQPLLRGKDMKQNLALQSEDIIFVPKTFLADLGRVLMQIIEPVSRGALTYETLTGLQ